MASWKRRHCKDAFAFASTMAVMTPVVMRYVAEYICLLSSSLPVAVKSP